MVVNVKSVKNGAYDVVTGNVHESESDFWKFVGAQLPGCDIPSDLVATDQAGYRVELHLKQRGSYKNNAGEELPSMLVQVGRNDFQNRWPSGTYPETMLVCVNPNSNNYKFYRMKQIPTGIDVEYGRLGQSAGEMFGARHVKVPYEPYLYWIRYYEKLSKGYVDRTAEYLGDGTEDTGDAKNDSEPAVTREGKPVRKADSELYDKLYAYAKHVVSVSLKSSTVTASQAKAARKLLNELAAAQDVDAFNACILNLVALSPRKVGKVSDLLATKDADMSSIYQREENLVNAMEAVASGRRFKATNGCFRDLGISVFYATDKQKQEVIDHLDYGLRSKVKNVYRVIPHDQKARFDAYRKAHGIHKVKLLWHGSRNENWYSIIKNGLCLNPQNVVVTGRMFGNGVYFAPSANKSWGYTSYHGTRWASGTDSVAFMGLYATAYGKPLDVTAPGRFNQALVTGRGCHCVHAHKGPYLHADEIIFYAESAMLLNYIVEFGD